MTQAPLTLYAETKHTSPYVMSVFVALHEKGLPFDLKLIDLSAREQDSANYAATSMTRRVPTLVHGDFSLSESSAICEYLEDCFPAPQHPAIYPTSVRERARARQVQAWIRSDMMPIRHERSTETVFYPATVQPLSAEARAAAAKLYAAADALLPAGARHLCGEWCIADTDLAMMLMRLVHHGDDVPERLASYARAQWQRPAVQKWLQLPRAR